MTALLPDEVSDDFDLFAASDLEVVLPIAAPVKSSRAEAASLSSGPEEAQDRPTRPRSLARSAAQPDAPHLRAWQRAALAAYRAKHADGNTRDFLAVATPGAGKTTFALQVASELLAAGVVRRITVVAPTEHLKTQWADAATRVGIALDPSFRNAQGKHGAHFDGVVLTYAQVAANPNLHRARTEAARTLVILDEIHHGGDALSWGDGIRTAFEDATRRLSLTGTPFRSDTAPIPFVDYQPGSDGVLRSQADYTYGYADALRDNVVRPVLFMTYSGEMHWRTSAGEVFSARLGEPLTKDLTAQAWRTALDPHGEWIRAVLKAADQRLTEVRRDVPDAGGLVIASDQATARAYAKLLHEQTGDYPTVVLSDDDGASRRIEAFRESRDRWMVAVRMVSEGVDVPRLAVGVYATNASTPLYFAQAIGRFVRARRRGETASVFLPNVLPLLDLAAALEVERDHALVVRKDDDGLDDTALAEANREEAASDELTGKFEPVGSSAAFDHVLYDGGQFGLGADVGSLEELGFLGLPGLVDPDEVAQLLRERQAAQAREAAARGETREMTAAEHRRAAELRKDLNRLVGAWARKSGRPHGSIHTQLRAASGGPEVPQATVAQLEKRIQTIRTWFAAG